MGGIGNMDEEWQIFVGAGRQIWMMGVGVREGGGGYGISFEI